VFFYWLAVAAIGAVSLLIPVAGWAFAAGAFAYLTSAIPGWLFTGGFFAHMEYRSTTFGIDNRRFAGLLAGLGVLACVAGLASRLHWLAWGGTFLLYLAGEWAVMDWMSRAGAPRPAA
jgi:hypothetical protein